MAEIKKKVSLEKMLRWKTLTKYYQQLAQCHIRDLFTKDPERFNRFHIEDADLIFDFSKNLVTEESLTALFHLAQDCELPQAIEDLFSGKKVNLSENQPAFHPVIRDLENNQPLYYDEKNIRQDIENTWTQVEFFVDRILQGKILSFNGKIITDILHLGIGGSDLGPRLLYCALAPYRNEKIQCHFVSNYGDDLDNILKKLSPDSTLVVVCSKSFTSAETLFHANKSLQWLAKAGGDLALKKQCIAVTADSEKACAFGIAPEHIFPIWSWIGGRFSISSAMVFSVICAIGVKHFKEFLLGMRKMDEHFRKTPISRNIPIIKALLAIWYNNFFNLQSHAIIPYSTELTLLPFYLKQLFMESLGKSVQQNGEPIHYQTGGIIWGGVGVDSQHSFHQLLLQGNQKCPIDFIVPLHSVDDRMEFHKIANCFSQSHVLMQGNLSQNKYQHIAGNIPSNTLLMNKLSPYYLGLLIACYEHQVYSQAVIWNINPFDQWGIHQGKWVAQHILASLNDKKSISHLDESTQGLIQMIQRKYSCEKLPTLS